MDAMKNMTSEDVRRRSAETRCIYCQKEYSTPKRFQAHIRRAHLHTYRAFFLEQDEL